MKLDEVAYLTGAGPADGAGVEVAEVAELAYDSRRAGPGCLFFCLPGAHHDGHDFAASAVHAGAAALVCERPLGLGVPELVVEDAREAMNKVAAPFYGHPSRNLRVAGVTGTKGKTTTCYMLRSIFEAAGFAAGIIGTVEIGFGTRTEPGVRTTPQSIDLQRLFGKMVSSGVKFCAMEATSIGLEQGRVEGTEFGVAVFTNLSRDHLDEYHGTMDAYYQSKALLFSSHRVAHCLINVDDEWGKRLMKVAGTSSLGFGMSDRADFRALDVELDGWGSRFRAAGLGADLALTVRMPGRVNVYNALAAAGAALLLGIDRSSLAEGIQALESVPGRFERIDEGQDFEVVVDYAHTPDSLREALSAARLLGRGKLIVVFGCGGDRDRAKRPLMGAEASSADLAVLTSDNPRTEDPMQIVRAIEEGISVQPPSGGYVTIPDRAEAIERAISRAEKGDVVLIAGKGHETHQELGGKLYPFDDREVAREILRGTS